MILEQKKGYQHMNTKTSVKNQSTATSREHYTSSSVTSQDGSELNSGSIEVGTSWSHTFAQPGTFPYFCTYHDEMKAVVVVK